MALTPFAIPKVLNNGAEILAYKRIRNSHMVVCAKTEIGVHPFVTWAVDDNGDAYWGHYFLTEDEAMKDWRER